MDDELVAKAREAMQARLNGIKEQQSNQYNLVFPLTAEQIERIIKALEGK